MNFEVGNIFTIDDKNIEVLSKLGQGSYGTVYKIKITNLRTRKVSIKAAKVITSFKNDGIKSLRELDIMGKILHKNLIHSHGIWVKSTLNRTTIIILMPLAESDMFTILTDKKFTTYQRIKLLRDITEGVNFLHKNGYLHLDLKPMNILVYSDKKKDKFARVTDFGLSLLLENNKKYYPQELITITYRPPEVLYGDYNYTAKTDIWSLGMIFLNVLSEGSTIFRRVDELSIKKTIATNLSPISIDRTLNTFLQALPLNIRDKAINLIKKMLANNPEDRPSTSQILKDPLFKIIKSGLSKGELLNANIYSPKDCDIIYYYGFDYIIRIAASLKIKLETVFLACDIYQRSLHHSFNLTGNFNTDWANILVLVSTCLYMAIKMIDTFYSDPNFFVKASNKIFTTQDILTMEGALTQILEGKIYSENLFTGSSSKERLLFGFEQLRNCHIYHKIDFDQWKRDDKRDHKGKYNKYIPFRDFFKDTEYYKLIKTSKQEEYIPILFEKDRKQ